MIRDIINNSIDSCGEYTEIRAHENTKCSVVINAGNVTSNGRAVSNGVSARVFKDGVFGFSSMGEYDENAVKSVLDKAKENAEFLSRRAANKEKKLYMTDGVKFQTQRDFVSVDQKDVLDYAKQIDEKIKTRYPRLSSRGVIVACDSMEKLLKTSTNTVSHQINPRACLYVSMAMEANDGTTVELMEVMKCGKGYFYDYFTNPDDMDEKLDTLYNQLVQKSEGVFSESGTCDCIIDSSISGMIAHEAVGHTVEADLVEAGSVANGKIGQQVASPLISIVDYANTALGKEAPLPVYVDDEGVEATDAVLIENGFLKEYMHSRLSADKFGGTPRGNARSFSFSDEPLIRMRNTLILPGKDKIEDMISSIDNGYYLIKTLNGQADTTGEFMFGITFGYEIKHGKLGRALRDTTISGVAFDMLKTVDMLSDTVEWSSSGYCGKKQLMPVSDGGPAIKCKVNIGGK